MRYLLPMFLLLACSGPAPLRPENLLQALPQLASTPGPLQADAAALLAMEPSRKAVQTAEVAALRGTVEEALKGGDLRRAAKVLALTRSPDPAFRGLAEQVYAALAGADPEMRADALLLLAEAMPERQAELRMDAADAAVRVRYAAKNLAKTRASQQKISRETAAALLSRLDAEYVVAPDWPAMAAAAQHRLQVLADSPEGRAAWPRLSDVVFTNYVPPVLLGSALQTLDQAVASGKAAGVPEEVLIAEWVSAGLSALDAWTRPVWPVEIASWEQENAGVRVGIGLELRLEGQEVMVLRPLPDSPAWTSGIHQGDRLDQLQDASGTLLLSALPVDERLAAAEAALAGDDGSELTLTVHAPTTAPRTVSLHRAPVPMETVEGYERGADNQWNPFFDTGLAYVHISRFRPTTDDSFDDLLFAPSTPVAGVLLDLRGNPGGDINAAVQIADRFIAEGTMATVSGRVLPKTTTETDPATGAPLPAWNEAVPGQSLENTPLVILVDEITASAAEVLAGSLQELRHAPVVGTATWGKGRAQKIYSDPAGAFGFQYTNFFWTLPSGRQLVHEVGGGIQPDLALPLSTAEGYQARRLAAQRAALRVHADGTPMYWVDPGLRSDIPSIPADPQLLAAQMLLRDAVSRKK